MSIRFRPLAGMVRLLPASLTWLLRFRPLTGMVPLWLPMRSGWSSFRPLTGMTLSVTAYAVPAPPKGGA